MKKKTNKFFHKVSVQETYADMKESQFKYLNVLFGHNRIEGLYTEINEDLINKVVEKIEKIEIPRVKKMSVEDPHFKDLEVLDLSTDDIKFIVKKYVGELEHTMSFRGSVLMTRKFSDSITLSKDQVQHLIDEYQEDGEFDFNSLDADELLYELGKDLEELDYDDESYDDTEDVEAEIPSTVITIDFPKPKFFADNKVMKEVA